MFVGIVGYADDLLPLSPSLDGLQEMVNNCEIFARSHNLTFIQHTPRSEKVQNKMHGILEESTEFKEHLAKWKIITLGKFLETPRNPD